MIILMVFIFVGFIAYIVQIMALRSLIKVNFSSQHLPFVSIIKPIKGIDDNLFDNLESFCNLDYPQYELIFSLSSCFDPAYKIVNKIKLKYPDRDISIVVDDSLHGLNPKINNMYKAYMMAKYDTIIISDSNVFVGKDYIKQTVKYLDNKVSVVTNPIRGYRALSFGALLENLQLNTFVVLGMAFLNLKTHIPCVVGKSILFRKKDLEEAGGFWLIKDYLAEDFMIGKLIKERNKQKVALSNYFIDNVNEYWNIKKFLNRHTRWAKMRWKIGGFYYVCEILVNPVFLAFTGLFILGFSNVSLSIFGVVWFLKVAFDYYVGYLINSDIKMFFYFLSPLKDIIVGVVWFVPFVNTKVYWRGKKYSIGKNTFLVESK